jgi:hypothetical protein
MSFFVRASWPGDHRDELVAGTLVAAVVVVLGYASGIGASAPTTVDTASPPAAGTSSPSRQPSAGSATGPPVTSAVNSGSGSVGGFGSGGGDSEIPVATSPVNSEGDHHHGTGGIDGNEPAPTPSSSPTPTPSPSPSGTCDEGEVRLVQPLLNGVVTPVAGLLDGLLGSATPAPTPSPAPSADTLSSLCVGVAPSPSVIPEVLP